MHPGTSPRPTKRLVRLLAVACTSVIFAVAAGGTAAAPAAAASGVDVSNWQHPGGAPIDWGQVRASGRAFAFIKATGDTTYTNPYFAGDWSGAAAAGMYRGAYHYAQPALPLTSAVAQARYFVSVTGTMQGGTDLPPVLDLETANGLGAGDLVAWTQTWLAEVQRLTGRAPMLYVGYYFWQDQLGSTSALAPYRLWLPWWTTDPTVVRVAPPWGAWTFWQWSNSGSVPGIPATVDLDNSCCSDANLAALGGGTGNPAAGNPFGSLDVAAHRQFGTIDVGGWAIDPDTTAPLTVHVYVDGVGAAILTANGSRPDVGGAYPGWGGSHGFVATVPAGPGVHQVCAYGINVGVGTANTQLGCRTVSNAPLGNVDDVSITSRGIHTAGWAMSPDTTAPIYVDLYLNGVGRAHLLANTARTDVAAAFPGYGAGHGYDATITGSGGTLCAYAINPTRGTNTQIGCKAVTNTPIGRLDQVTVTAGRMHAAGWAISPNTTAPIYVDLYLNGVGRAHLLANSARTDVAAAFPGYGAGHGFDVTFPGTGGTVCAYAINPTGRSNPQIGCATR